MLPQVRVNYIKLGGYVALCLGAHNLHQNTAVYPVAHYNAFCYTSQVSYYCMRPSATSVCGV